MFVILMGVPDYRSPITPFRATQSSFFRSRTAIMFAFLMGVLDCPPAKMMGVLDCNHFFVRGQPSLSRF